jgi:hypothetical protein
MKYKLPIYGIATSVQSKTKERFVIETGTSVLAARKI